jgi:preprotein translocase subunit YajC
VARPGMAGKVVCSMVSFNPALLAQGQPGGLGAFSGLLPILLIMVIFYVLLIMPAQRRQKKTAAMLQALKMGDKVITTGGVYGIIVGLEDEAVQLRIADQVKVKVLRSAVAGLQPEETKEA